MTERQALLIAGSAHLLLLAALSLGFTLNHREFPVPEEIVPVEVVQISDLVKTADAPPPVVKAAPAIAPEPDPAPAPAPPPPATPPPEPKPEPKPQTKPTPTPDKPAPAKVPKPAPVPAKTAPPKPAPSKPAPPKPETKRLDTAELSSLLDKTLPKAKARPAPSLDAAALAKSLDAALPHSAHADPRATATLQAAIRAQIAPCWNPPIGGADVKKMTVLLHIELARDGSLQGRPGLVSQTGATAGNADYARAFAETARRAVLRCAPLKLPAELYDQWKSFELNFDPSELT